jgi:hypothetical protein
MKRRVKVTTSYITLKFKGLIFLCFADDTCIYATEKHESHVVCKLQSILTPANSWCVRWNRETNEGKIQAICFSRRLTVPDDVLQLKGRNISFVNNVTYLGVTFDRRMTWTHHVDRTLAKALGVYIRTFSLSKVSV